MLISEIINYESFLRKLKLFQISYSSLSPSSQELITNSIKSYPSVRIGKKIDLEAFKWCEENLGNNWIWSSPALTEYTDIYFLETEMATLFKLKFGGLCELGIS